MHRRRFILLLLTALCTPLTGFAQGNVSFIPQGISVTLTPPLPQPDSEVTATLDDYAVSASGASIRWYLDETPIPATENAREVQFQAGALGEPQTLRVELTPTQGGTLTYNTTITPARVDLILEADTFVPTFYRGGAVPSVGSTLRVTALTFDGTNRTPDQYTYTWRLNGTVLEGGPLRGGNTIELTTPTRPQSFISVEVRDSSGTVVARRSITLPRAEPKVVFYPVSTLNDVAHIALGSTAYNFTETTVRAQPYFLALESVVGETVTEWKLNGQLISTPTTGSYEVSVLRVGGGLLSFTLQDPVNFNQRAAGSVNLTF